MASKKDAPTWTQKEPIGPRSSYLALWPWQSRSRKKHGFSVRWDAPGEIIMEFHRKTEVQSLLDVFLSNVPPISTNSDPTIYDGRFEKHVSETHHFDDCQNYIPIVAIFPISHRHCPSIISRLSIIDDYRSYSNKTTIFQSNLPAHTSKYHGNLTNPYTSWDTFRGCV